jgi:Tol biopolymer transport system component
MTIISGTHLGPYEIIALLGAGGMGEVYRALDARLDREVAIKVLPEAFSADADWLARFKREAQVLAALNHPNIASIYGLEESDGLSALVMELVEGPTLAEQIAAGPLPLDEALPIARQIAEALEATHERGVIHRDLKPANVKVTPEGQVKVLDFGLAKLTEKRGAGVDTEAPTAAKAMTDPGTVMGTAHYMSPEQAKGKAVDRRTDIWAFGCVLYEMLTGRQPFGGETLADVLAAVVRAEPHWDALPTATPPVIRKLLRRCLTKDPKQRLRDIGEARIVLEEPEDQAIAATPMEASSSARNLRRRILWAAGTLLSVALTALAVWVMKPTPEPPLRRFALALPPGGRQALSRPAISPDGERLAYVSEGSLWIHELRELQPRRLDGTQGAAMPFWSPDSRWVAYGVGKRLFKVPAGGGEPISIAELPQDFSPAAGGGWRSDGRMVISTGYSGLYEVPDRGGDLRSVLALNPETDQDFHHPSLLPDGRGVIYNVHAKGDLPGGLEVYDGRSRKVLLRQKGIVFDYPVYSPTGHLLFRRTPTNVGVWAVPFSLSRLETTSDPFLVVADNCIPTLSQEGTLAYATGGEDPIGIFQLAWVDRAGKMLGKTGQPQREITDPTVSPDGSRVAVAASENGAWAIWVHDLDRGTKTRLTFGPGVFASPAWSPAGDRVAYVTRASNFTGLPLIAAKEASGRGEEQRITEGSRPNFSPDGKYLIYEKYAGGLEYVPLSGEKKASAAPPASAGKAAFPQLSRDGHYLAYVSEESGRQEVYVTTFPAGEGKWQVSLNGGTSPRWSRSGKELFYLQANQLMAAAIELGPSLQTGTPRKLFDLAVTWQGFTILPWQGFDVAADGQRFVVVTDAETVKTEKGGVVVVQNWFAEFKDKQQQ